MKKVIGIALAAVCAVSACNSAEKQENKSLVVYYSQTGATEKVAQMFAEKTGADILKIDAQNPYDGDFNATIARCQEEMKDGILPALDSLDKNIEDYDTIYLGYPIWFGIAAPPMKTFVKQSKFEGKVIIPFSTFGSGGLETGIADLKADLEGATILDGYGVRNARVEKADKEIDRFLIEIGVKEGEIEELPEFSVLAEITADDQAIFDAACGDYPMPLGTPEGVGSRKIENGTEYLFTVRSTTPDGQESVSAIYVLSLDGEKPEFTKVVR